MENALMNSARPETKNIVPPQSQSSSAQNGSDDQPIDDVPMFRRKRVLLPFSILFLAVIGGAWYWYVQHFLSVATDDASVDANRVTISAKLLGRIVALKADEGDTVQQGDTLVRLDDVDLRAQLARAEASIRYLTRSAEIASVNLAKAMDDFDRIDKQFKGQIVSQEQYNHAESARRLAEAQNDMAESQIATAQADCAIVKTQLANTILIAPFGGVIAKRWALAGDVVSPGQAIFSMFDHRHLWVTANYEETKLRSIRPGLSARVTVDAFPGTVLRGKVLSIGQSTASLFSLIPAGNAAGNFTKITQRVPVKISVDAPAHGISLLPGLSVYVRIFPR
jgi:membrane fusion protein (multidrug efflux system)